MTTDKLAEEILKPFIVGSKWVPVINKDDAIKAMQAYHEAKMKERLIDYEKFCGTYYDDSDELIDRYFKQK